MLQQRVWVAILIVTAKGNTQTEAIRAALLVVLGH